MKVIFLDIDGVLNYMDFWYKRRLEFEKTGKFGPSFDEEKIKILSEIVSETGAKIVLSSTWRGGFVKDKVKDKLVPKPNFEDCIELNLAFEKYNLEIYDRTTDVEGKIVLKLNLKHLYNILINDKCYN